MHLSPDFHCHFITCFFLASFNKAFVPPQTGASGDSLDLEDLGPSSAFADPFDAHVPPVNCFGSLASPLWSWAHHGFGPTAVGGCLGTAIGASCLELISWSLAGLKHQIHFSEKSPTTKEPSKHGKWCNMMYLR